MYQGCAGNAEQDDPAVLMIRTHCCSVSCTHLRAQSASVHAFGSAGLVCDEKSPNKVTSIAPCSGLDPIIGRRKTGAASLTCYNMLFLKMT